MIDRFKRSLRRRRRVGKKGENAAVRLLREKGYSIIDRNVRMKYGEIDIVARDGEQIVFIEVKSRTSKLYSPRSGWSPAQQKRLLMCAGEYIAKVELSSLIWRIELVEAVFNKWLFCRNIIHRQAAAAEYTLPYSRGTAGERVRRFP